MRLPISPAYAASSMPLLLLPLLATVWAMPAPASACGGFFCSRQPVDQTAERILFSVDDGGTITARIQIRYVGERDAFAWLLPVAGVPELDTFPELGVQALDLATEPRYRSFICGGQLLLDGGGSGPGHATPLLRQPVGPFDTVVLQGDTAEAVVAWLRDNDYRISDAMVPLLQPYVDQGLNFVAMKLLPDADVSDIEPISITYEGSEPSIPIRLTAVAAQPEMGVITYILADRRYEASNYENFVVDDADIRFSEWGDCNYLPLISRRVDELGGQAFATEYAGPTEPLLQQFLSMRVPDDPDVQEANDAVVELLRRHPYVTRLYSRISAHEMTLDPVFAPAAEGGDLSNEHDLDGSEECTDDPCAFIYCGDTSSCVTSAGEALCVCAPETTARMTADRFGRQAVFCEPMVSDLGGSAQDGDSPDPCADYDCGRGGECAAMNGNPTCRCGELGTRVARVRADGTLGAVCETFEPPAFVPEPQPLPQPGQPTTPPAIGQQPAAGAGDGAPEPPDAALPPRVDAVPMATQGDGDVLCAVRPVGAGARGGGGGAAATTMLLLALGLLTVRRRR